MGIMGGESPPNLENLAFRWAKGHCDLLLQASLLGLGPFDQRLLLKRIGQSVICSQIRFV